MGFHLINGSDAEFVTSGHCSDQPSQSKTWYQPSPSASSKIYLGLQQSQLYPGNSVDMQRIELPNNQKSKYIFGEPGKLVYGRSNPSTGALVYGSLGHSFAVRSGTVYTAWGTYTAEGHDLLGTNVHQLVTGGGDSGSPLYYRSCCDRLYALAVYSAGGSVDRWWARIIDGVVRWPGWDIYN